MFKNIEDFKKYIGIVYKNKMKKMNFRKINFDECEKLLSKIKDLSKETLFDKNSLYLILENGEVVTLPRKIEKNHSSAFRGLEKIIPNLFLDFSLENKSGYEISCYLAANGKVVLWTSDINNPEIQIMTIPKLMSTEQCLSLKRVFTSIDSSKPLYVSSACYKNKGFSKIKVETVANSGDFSNTNVKLRKYIENNLSINELTLEEFDLDFEHLEYVKK